MINFVAKVVAEAIIILCKLVAIFLPSLFVILVLTTPIFSLNQGQTIVSLASKTNNPIHYLFPAATWNDLEPCGLHFDEQKEFNTALQCVNENVWKETPLVKPEQTHIPRCFVVKATAKDVFSRPDIGFNFLPMFFFSENGLELGAVVGVYDPITRTVFVVENIDAALVYRHELQHYFLHLHDPETEGGGHHQEIWHQCEPPYYTPSDRVKPVELMRPKVFETVPSEPKNNN